MTGYLTENSFNKEKNARADRYAWGLVYSIGTVFRQGFIGFVVFHYRIIISPFLKKKKPGWSQQLCNWRPCLSHSTPLHPSQLCLFWSGSCQVKALPHIHSLVALPCHFSSFLSFFQVIITYILTDPQHSFPNRPDSLTDVQAFAQVVPLSRKPYLNPTPWPSGQIQ